MKKLICILALILLLSGCSGQRMLETVSDTMDTPVMANMQQVELTLPKGAAMATMENSDGGKLYLCDGYYVTVQTLPGGSLDQTLQTVTGFTREQLTLMERKAEQLKQYDCVWASAGEGEDQVARGTILDDGVYHYVVTVMAPFSTAGDLSQTWQSILSSVSLSTD